MYTGKELLEYVASQPHNYENPETRGNALLGVTLAFVALSVTGVALRFIARARGNISLGSDDLLAMIALIPIIGLAVVTVLGIKRSGWNRHIYDIPPPMEESNAKMAYAAKLLFIVADTLVRMSALYFYKRMHAGITTSPFLSMVNFVQILNIVLGLAALLGQATICVPLNLFWSIETRDSIYCRSDSVVTFTYGTAFCALNILTCVLPMPVLYKLQRSLKFRLGMMALFSVGILATAASFVRNYYAYKSLFVSFDQTWYGYPFWMEVNIESNLGLLCACIPTFRSLFGPSPKAVAARQLQRIYARESISSGRVPLAAGTPRTPVTPLKSALIRTTDRGLPVITEDGEIVNSPYSLDSSSPYSVSGNESTECPYVDTPTKQFHNVRNTTVKFKTCEGDPERGNGT